MTMLTKAIALTKAIVIKVVLVDFSEDMTLRSSGIRVEAVKSTVLYHLCPQVHLGLTPSRRAVP